MKGDYLNKKGFASYTMYQRGSWRPEAKSQYFSNEELLGESTGNRWGDNPYGIVAWWGHGNEHESFIGYGAPRGGPIFGVSEILSLNESMPAITYQNSCSNGTPEISDNLQYSLLIRGAIGAVGASRVSWYLGGEWIAGRINSDNAAIGYYYLSDVANGARLGAALYLQKAQMGSAWEGKSWMNLLDINLYGDPYVSIDDHGK
jgi:hypothetical protein